MNKNSKTIELRLDQNNRMNMSREEMENSTFDYLEILTKNMQDLENNIDYFFKKGLIDAFFFSFLLYFSRYIKMIYFFTPFIFNNNIYN